MDVFVFQILLQIPLFSASKRLEPFWGDPPTPSLSQHVRLPRPPQSAQFTVWAPPQKVQAGAPNMSMERVDMEAKTKERPCEARGGKRERIDPQTVFIPHVRFPDWSDRKPAQWSTMGQRRDQLSGITRLGAGAMAMPLDCGEPLGWLVILANHHRTR